LDIKDVFDIGDTDDDKDGDDGIHEKSENKNINKIGN
jgi:hypothetical protein